MTDTCKFISFSKPVPQYTFVYTFFLVLVSCVHCVNCTCIWHFVKPFVRYVRTVE